MSNKNRYKYELINTSFHKLDFITFIEYMF